MEIKDLVWEGDDGLFGNSRYLSFRRLKNTDIVSTWVASIHVSTCSLVNPRTLRHTVCLATGKRAIHESKQIILDAIKGRFIWK